MFAACVARKNPLYTNMLIIDRQSSGSERVTRETAKALTRKNIEMAFGVAAIIKDAVSGDRYELDRASSLPCLIATGGVAVIRPAFLRPAHECRHPASSHNPSPPPSPNGP